MGLPHEGSPQSALAPLTLGGRLGKDATKKVRCPKVCR